MKRVLSFILTMMIAFALGTSIVTADEWVETLVSQSEANGSTAEELVSQLSGFGLTLNTETMQITDGEGNVLSEEEFYTALYGGSSASQNPTEEDYASQKQYTVYDFSDAENILYTQYVVGTDKLLESIKNYYSGYLEWTDTEYNGQKAIMMSQTVAAANSGEVGIAYREEKGFFADKKIYAVANGDMTNSGYDKGKVIGELIFEFGNNEKEVKEIKVGENNSLIVVRTEVHGVNILIVVMCLVVLILIIVTVILTIRAKRKANKQNALDNSEYVSEDEVFDELVEEAANEVEVYEADDVQEQEEEVTEVEEISEEEENK